MGPGATETNGGAGEEVACGVGKGVVKGRLGGEVFGDDGRDWEAPVDAARDLGWALAAIGSEQG